MAEGPTITTRACLRSFLGLCAAFERLPPGHRFSQQISLSAIQDEFGRFRVWTSNIGASKTGHRSLSWRLRDAPLVLDSLWKLLKELDASVQDLLSIASFARLPLEEQPQFDGPRADDSSHINEDETIDEDSDSEFLTELQQQLTIAANSIDHLYKLSRYIRNPSSRTRFSKAASLKAEDPETGIDLIEQFEVFDKQHVRESLHELRKHLPSEIRLQDDVLCERLGRGITRRRQQFFYWKQHREKLSISSRDEGKVTAQDSIQQLQGKRLEADRSLHSKSPDPHAQTPPTVVQPSVVTKSAGTGTIATHFESSGGNVDTIEDDKSVISTATTALGIEGETVIIPRPPTFLTPGRDIECPYCYTICPSSYLKERNWR